jgi:hypothetical protein
MTYKTHYTLPAYEQVVRSIDTGKVLNHEGALKWSGDQPPPAVGTVIAVTMWTAPGLGEVTGYFEEGGWLGLLTRMWTAPDWFAKQNPGRIAHVFGPEWRLPDMTGTPNEVDLAALQSYADEHGKKWKDDLWTDWYHARTPRGPGWPERGTVLHCLRNSAKFGPTALHTFKLKKETTHA